MTKVRYSSAPQTCMLVGLESCNGVLSALAITKGLNMSNDGHEIELNIIVNGKAFEIEANVNEPLKTVIPKALAAAGQQGRRNEDWQLKLNGNPLPLDAKIKDLGLTDEVTLFLTLETGTLG